MAEPTYRDFDLSLKRHPLTADIATSTDEEAIKISLKNLLRLATYDKPFNPEIASPLYTMLFEPVDSPTATLMKVDLRFLINQYETRIENLLVDVKPYPEENKYEIMLEFTVKKNSSKQSLSLFLPVERLR
jgi:phage baseplate assembly protein W